MSEKVRDTISQILDLQHKWDSKATPEMKERGHLVRDVLRHGLEELVTDRPDSIPEMAFEGRDGTGLKTRVPWARIFSRKYSPSATNGWYLVFLFAFDGKAVYLSLNQGTTEGDAFQPKDSTTISKRVIWARDLLHKAIQDTAGLLEAIQLQDPAYLGKSYETGNVYAVKYDRDALPSDAKIKADIVRLLGLLGELYHAEQGVAPLQSHEVKPHEPKAPIKAPDDPFLPKQLLPQILDHFRGHPDFLKWQPKWGEEITAYFCRFVQAVHEAGLDIWFTKGATGQVRFGRKDKDWQRGRLGGWICFLSNGVELSWKAIGKLAAIEDWTSIRAELVEVMEQFSKTLGEGELLKLYGDPNRFLPYWPDDYDDLFGDENELPVPKKEKAAPVLPRAAFNRIYYGPPGTGKTFKLLNLLNESYTDTQAKEEPERWLIDQIRDRNWFQIIAMILLDARRPIKVADIVGHRFYQAKAKANGRTGNLTQTAWGYLQRHTWSKSTTVDYAQARRAEIAVFDKDDGINWFIVDELKEQLADLVPVLAKLNAGPESGAVKKRYAFVTFHQSYGYEEFVEGLRPELGSDATGQVCYEISQGALRKLCAQAEADPGSFYAMVIDEINRGNISKIFGELITLIEIDKRAGSELAVPVTLPYSGDKFIIPPNVDFIGTMNTADRSLALVDTALRRRFEFVPILPKADVLADLVIIEQGVTINVQQLLVAMNNRIEALYDRDHTIGHAYFTQILKQEPSDQFNALKTAFQKKIIPLLEEYFFEDWQKIRLVLGDNQKEEAFQFIRAVGREEDLLELFGLNHELDQYATRARYRLNEASLDIPQTYAGIYAPSGSASPL